MNSRAVYQCIFVILICIMTVYASAYAGDQAASQPAAATQRADTPDAQIRDLFRRFFACALKGDRAGMARLTLANTVLEKELADGFAEYSLAEAAFEQAVRDKFGAQVAAAAIHDVNDFPVTDADILTITLDGNRAIAESPAVDNPAYVILDQGVWKFWIRGWVARMPRETVKEVAVMNRKAAGVFQLVLRRLNKDELKTGDEMRQVLKKAMTEIGS